MARLILVRHAQASFFAQRYDALSELGLDQARRLGEHWADTGLKVAHAFVGPRQRHAQTYAQVAQVYHARGLEFPHATAMPELDEHDGIAVAKAHLGAGDPASDAIPGSATHSDSAQADAAKSAALRAILDVLREWARGQIVVPGFETWEEFRARVLRALDGMCEQAGTGAAVAFTSGGVVSAAAGWILGLDADHTMDLHTVVRNASLTEVGFTGRRRRLVAFNGIPHLLTPELATLI